MTNRFGGFRSSFNMTVVRQTVFCFLSYTLAVIAVVVAMAKPAQACRLGSEKFYLTTTVPRQLPDGSLVADVEVVSVERPSLARYVITTRVRSAIAGDRFVREIVIDPDGVSSCDVIPRVGDHGFVVGSVRSITNDVAIVEPVRSPGIGSDHVFQPQKQFGVGHIVERRRP